MMSVLYKRHDKDIMSYVHFFQNKTKFVNFAHFFYAAIVNRNSLKLIVEVRDVLIICYFVFFHRFFFSIFIVVLNTIILIHNLKN